MMEDTNIHFDIIDKDENINTITFCCNKLVFETTDKPSTIEMDFDPETLEGMSNGDFSTVNQLIFTNGKRRFTFSKLREESI